MKLPDAKYDVAGESVVVEPQSFSRRTASVSSTGSAAALFMRQRSMRGRLESRLTQARAGDKQLKYLIDNALVFWVKGRVLERV